MASQVDIVNAALRLLGANRITALDQSTKEARSMEEAWDMTRDAALAAYPWNFAIAYASVAAEADMPAHTWDASYPVPADCLRVLDCPDLLATEWTMGRAIGQSGRAVLADTSGNLNLKYIAQITETTAWDACFVSYMAARLAKACVEDITESESAYQRIKDAMKEAMNEAYMTDAIEGPPEDLPADDWIAGRL